MSSVLEFLRLRHRKVALRCAPFNPGRAPAAEGSRGREGSLTPPYNQITGSLTVPRKRAMALQVGWKVQYSSPVPPADVFGPVLRFPAPKATPATPWCEVVTRFAW